MKKVLFALQLLLLPCCTTDASQHGSSDDFSPERPTATPRTMIDDSFTSQFLLYPDEKLQLTYCISRALDDFPEEEIYQEIVTAMDQAAYDWERATDVNFIHLEAFDDETSCVDYDPDGPVFRVVRGSGSGCAGNAFGPENLHTVFNPHGRRLDLTDPEDCSDSSLVFVVRHELGHIVGADHEHEHAMNNNPNTNGSSLCESQPLRGFLLSPYDPYSVMMYRQCDFGGNAGNTHLSSLDVQAFKYAYVLPRVVGNDYNGDGLTDIYFWTSDPDLGDQILYGGDVLSLQESDTLGPDDYHRPLSGDFNGDGLHDIYFYSDQIGEVVDPLFLKQGGGNGFTVSNQYPSDGPMAQPMVGHFYGSSTVDLLFSDVGFWSDAPVDSSFLMVPHTPPNALQDNTLRFTQLVGDYDGDGSDEILWLDFAVDSGDQDRYFDKDSDVLQWNWTPFDHKMKMIFVSNTSQVIYSSATGDYDGDGSSDILWYAPERDIILWYGGLDGPGTEVFSLGNPFDQDFKVFSYDLTGAGKDQIYWFAQEGQSDFLWELSFVGDEINYAETEIVPPNPRHKDMLPIPGNFRNNGVGDTNVIGEVYWWNPVGDSELLTQQGDNYVFGPAPSGVGFPVGYSLQ